MTEISINQNTLLKTLFLTLLAFPARVSKFHALSLSRSIIEKDSMTLLARQKFFPKNRTHNFASIPVKLPALKNNTVLCPVTTMKQYLDYFSRTE